MSISAGASGSVRNATPASRRAMGRRGNDTQRKNAYERRERQYSDIVPF